MVCTPGHVGVAGDVGHTENQIFQEGRRSLQGQGEEGGARVMASRDGATDLPHLVGLLKNIGTNPAGVGEIKTLTPTGHRLPFLPCTIHALHMQS